MQGNCDRICQCPDLPSDATEHGRSGTFSASTRDDQILPFAGGKLGGGGGVDFGQGGVG